MVVRFSLVGFWFDCFTGGLKDATRERGVSKQWQTGAPLRPRRRLDRREHGNTRRQRDQKEGAPEGWGINVCPSDPEIGFATHPHSLVSIRIPLAKLLEDFLA
ncbi:MAG: hypothetical protein ABSA45_09595 [Verrucomicrobiota bacterium]